VCEIGCRPLYVQDLRYSNFVGGACGLPTTSASDGIKAIKVKDTDEILNSW
jgi:hypothetical protein